MISAYDFGWSTRDGEYSFGTDPAKTARALRQLADDLEAKVVLVAGVTVVTKATADKFTETRVLLRLTEKLEGM